MRSFVPSLLWTMLLIPGLIMAANAQDLSSPIKSDERVVLFPTVAQQSDDGTSWKLTIHGWIFEPEEDSTLRTYLIGQLTAALNLKEDAARSALFQQRMRLFLRDNERGKRIVVRVAERDFRLAASAVDGHFIDSLEIGADAVEANARDGWLTVRALTPPDDQREFVGNIQLLAPHGISVISDIDDTVKVTEVNDKRRLLENTFYKPFRAVGGMADLYRDWQEQGTTFHFVSSSPWQLYEPLSEFLSQAGFPHASFHLKRIRLKDRSVLQLLADSFAYKVAAIEELLKAYPQRRFILVGDSGEQDPEVYGHLAREYPDRILRILIRQVTDEPRDASRYAQAMKDIPDDAWQLFREHAEIMPIR